MYSETKMAVLKAFKIGKILFTMDPQRYKHLLKLTSLIQFPTEKEINQYVEMGNDIESSIAIILRERYIDVAVKNGFTEEQGLAMLNYAALLEETKNV